MLTFHGPYRTTGNPYFACWAALLASVLLCADAYTKMKVGPLALSLTLTSTSALALAPALALALTLTLALVSAASVIGGVASEMAAKQVEPHPHPNSHPNPHPNPNPISSLDKLMDIPSP